MLADVSEAVTHSMKDPSQAEVEETMSKVFKARWEDEQFNESGLSIEELERVKQGFLRVWRTLHHDRLRYPSTTTGRMPVPPPGSQYTSGSVPLQLAKAAGDSQSERKISQAAEPLEPEDSCCGGSLSAVATSEPRTASPEKKELDTE